MSEAIDVLISKYLKEVELIEGDVAETDEFIGDDFNPSNASGGNFDDAYYMGTEHGELFEKYRLLKTFIKDLKALKEDD